METLQKLIRTGCACISCCKDLISTPCSGNRTTFKVQLGKLSLDLEISPLIGRDHHAERAYFYLPWRYSHREKNLQCRVYSNQVIGQLHLKVRSASIAAFMISLAISAHFVWISSKNFSYFNISHKSSSFIT